MVFFPRSERPVTVTVHGETLEWARLGPRGNWGFRTTDGTLLSYRDLISAEPGSGPFFDLGGEPVVLRTGL